MKKLLILFAALLMGVTASFGQAYTINVQWDEALCDCLGTDEDNYFEIDYKIIDVANGNTEVISLTTVQTPNANYSNWHISVSAVSTYCGSIHDNTPSLKVFVWGSVDGNLFGSNNRMLCWQGRKWSIYMSDFCQWINNFIRGNPAVIWINSLWPSTLTRVNFHYFYKV